MYCMPLKELIQSTDNEIMDAILTCSIAWIHEKISTYSIPFFLAK